MGTSYSGKLKMKAMVLYINCNGGFEEIKKSINYSITLRQNNVRIIKVTQRVDGILLWILGIMLC